MDRDLEIRNLKREIEILKRRLYQRPVINTPIEYRRRTLIIEGGNTLETGQDGILFYDAGVIESVPSAYDPDVDTTFIDGIGRARMIENGGLLPNYVLVANDYNGTMRNALFNGDPISTGGYRVIPVDGGGSVRVWTV